jgi:putative ABC transport system substrate-binding protein
MVALAQQPGMPVIGLLDPRSPEVVADRLRGFRQGLKDTGYVEGENVALEYRWAENQSDRLAELAADLVRRRVAVIAATGGPASALAANAATTTIPILFLVRKTRSNLGLSPASPGPAATRQALIFSQPSWLQSGWNSCVSWCPQPLVLQCSSIRLAPRPRPR